jgi:hypothetical protein
MSDANELGTCSMEGYTQGNNSSDRKEQILFKREGKS